MNCDSLPELGAEWTVLSSHEIPMPVLCLRVSGKSVGRAYREGLELMIVDTNALFSLRPPALAVYPCRLRLWRKDQRQCGYVNHGSPLATGRCQLTAVPPLHCLVETAQLPLNVGYRLTPGVNYSCLLARRRTHGDQFTFQA